MDKFRQHTGIAVPVVRNNIDTDTIIPSREMKTVSKLGLSDGLFSPWRYTAPIQRRPNPEFALNKPEYCGASILLSGNNFGCGSSREHAVWALKSYGFRCIIAESFGSIFFRNCIRNGLLPISLNRERIDNLVALVAEAPQKNQIQVDLVNKQLGIVDQQTVAFSVSETDRTLLLEGLDQIDATHMLANDIARFAQDDKVSRPWLYG